MALDPSQWSRILTADSSRAGAGPRVHIGQRGAYVQKRHSDVHAAASVSAWLPCASGADAAGAVPNRVARPWLGANPVFRCLVRHRGGLAVQPVPRSAGSHSQPSIPRGKTLASAQEGQVLDFAVPALAAHLTDQSLDQEPEPLQVANHQPPRHLIRMNRRWSGWTGRAFIGYRVAKASTCACATTIASVITTQLTTSEQGGVVREPAYRK